MSELQSMIGELQSYISRAKIFRVDAMPVTALESIINKYENQKPGNTSDQPGEWQIRGGNVEAIQHDGTVERGQEVLHWIREERNGSAYWFQENGFFYIGVDSPRQPNIVGPGWWVVKTADNVFFAVSDADFHIIYVPRES